MVPTSAGTARPRGRPRKYAVPPSVIATYIVSLPAMRHDLNSIMAHFKQLSSEVELPRRRSREHQAWIVALCKGRELLEKRLGKPFTSRHGQPDRRIRIYSMGEGDAP